MTARCRITDFESSHISWISKGGYLARDELHFQSRGIVAIVRAPTIVGIATRKAGVPSTTAPAISKVIETRQTKTIAKLICLLLDRDGRCRRISCAVIDFTPLRSSYPDDNPLGGRIVSALFRVDLADLDPEDVILVDCLTWPIEGG